jgi:outer membrane lipopolysaccharide assembly protein LptE/RlpB
MRRLPIIAALLVTLTACGYHAVGGRSTRLPKDIRTIAVPAFTNQTQTYRIEQIFTAAVVREFLTRTDYHILNEASDSADATLRGSVTTTTIVPETYDSATGRASSAIVTVVARVQLVDRHGRVLYEQPNYVFREQYQVSRELSSFFEEENPALQRLSRDFARTLVSNILDAF